MANNYQEMAALAMVGERVLDLVLETGLVVRRQKPGRKPGMVEEKPALASGKTVKPVKPAKVLVGAKGTFVADPDAVEED